MNRKEFHPQSFNGVERRPNQSIMAPPPPPSPAPTRWPFLLAGLIGVLVLGGILYVWFTPPAPQTPPATTEKAPQPQQAETETTPVLILWYEKVGPDGKEGIMVPFNTLEGIQHLQGRVKKISVVLPAVLGKILTFQIRHKTPVIGKSEQNLHGDFEFTPSVPMGPGVYEISGTLIKFPNTSLLCFLQIE